MALSADTRPHFTTIANFISSMVDVIAPLFRDVLTVCYTEGLIGRRGKPVKSNITDNESAKLVSSHGVIQGYNGIATLDADHQMVVDAQAFGDVHEAAHVKAIIETDPQFRKRDPRFANQQEHKAKTTDRKRTSKARKYFGAAEFIFNDDGVSICPAGKPMKSSCPNWKRKGYPEHCGNCPLQSQCLRSPNSPVRQVTKTDSGIRHNKKSAIQRMMERFDTERGRHYYSKRMDIVEPVFGNTRATLDMDSFTLRGRRKVDAQWKLYCTVHNVGKPARYGPSFAGATA
jgi:hypothetical protein